MTVYRRQPMRADALANRERLLMAAESHFSEYGLDAPLQGIAETAGVGTGTLYRNFASHDELIDALFERVTDKFRDVATLAAAQPTGWLALETFLRESVEFLLNNPATSEIMRRKVENTLGGRPTATWVEPLTAFVEWAQLEGSARPDLSGVDLSAAPLALGAMQNFSPEVRHSVAARMVGLMLDGMRAHPHSPSELPIDADSVTGVSIANPSIGSPHLHQGRVESVS